jgi:FixJ family two-component response regulator
MAETGCLLLDVIMPGMGGLGLQRHLAEIGLCIPIVFLSARASDVEKRLALQAGATTVLRKPVSKEVLISAIHAALHGPPNNEQKDSL